MRWFVLRLVVLVALLLAKSNCRCIHKIRNENGKLISIDLELFNFDKSIHGPIVDRSTSFGGGMFFIDFCEKMTFLPLKSNQGSIIWMYPHHKGSKERELLVKASQSLNLALLPATSIADIFYYQQVYKNSVCAIVVNNPSFSPNSKSIDESVLDTLHGLKVGIPSRSTDKHPTIFLLNEHVRKSTGLKIGADVISRFNNADFLDSLITACNKQIFRSSNLTGLAFHIQNGRMWNLGSQKRIELYDNGGDDHGITIHLSKGSSCISNSMSHREAVIVLKCGLKNDLMEYFVEKPCIYRFLFESSAACLKRSNFKNPIRTSIPIQSSKTKYHSFYVIGGILLLFIASPFVFVIVSNRDIFFRTSNTSSTHSSIPNDQVNYLIKQR